MDSELELDPEVQRRLREIPPLLLCNLVLIVVGVFSVFLCALKEELDPPVAATYRVGPFVPLWTSAQEFRDSWKQRWTARPHNYCEVFFYNNGESSEVRNFRPQKCVFSELNKKTESEIGLADYKQNCDECRQIVCAEVQGRQTKIMNILKTFLRLKKADIQAPVDTLPPSSGKDSKRLSSSKRKGLEMNTAKPATQKSSTVILQPTPDDPNRFDVACNYCDLDTLSYSARFQQRIEFVP